jgi:membrane-bound serine protease (ClpP class)
MKRNLREWLVVILSLADDAAVVLLVLLGLWLAGIQITLSIISGLLVFFIVLTIMMHRLIIPVLRKKPVTGVEGMIGTSGTTITPLNPGGLIRIRGENWQAISFEGDIEPGKKVIIVSVEGLILKVKKG